LALVAPVATITAPHAQPLRGASPPGCRRVAGSHGALTRVGVAETAVPHREEGWNLLIPSVWTDPADTEANIAWNPPQISGDRVSAPHALFASPPDFHTGTAVTKFHDERDILTRT
jgi:hypothetical protein